MTDEADAQELPGDRAARLHAMRVRAIANVTAAIERFSSAGLSPLVPDGVAGACHVIDIALMADCIPDLIGCEPVVRSVKRTTIADGRADYLLFHQGGAVTAIEVADDRYDDFVLAGLEPLLARGQAIAVAFQPAIVRCILACNVDGDCSQHFTDACRAVGVAFVPLGSNEGRRGASLSGDWRP